MQTCHVIRFDSCNMAPLIFADQFIQIGTRLSSPYVYGLGERQGSLALDTHWTKIVLWNADQPVDVSFSHSVSLLVLIFIIQID